MMERMHKRTKESNSGESSSGLGCLYTLQHIMLPRTTQAVLQYPVDTMSLAVGNSSKGLQSIYEYL